MSSLEYAVWLSLAIRPALKAGDKLLTHFNNDFEAIYKADEAEYLEILGNDCNETLEALCNKELEQSLRIIDYCERQNIGIVTLDSKLYPKRLGSIPQKPILLYFKGRFPDFDNNACIATVGTRRASEYGRRNAYVISRDLAKGGAIVVSGMARGIDSICHRAALDAKGFTVAVLGCGIDVVYPPENESLMNEISLCGTVITEFAPGSEPVGSNFPVRNRIISGLSCGTLVIEADEKSGAMITAHSAQRQGRDLFALPGNVGELTSLGTNSLIMDGAKMITSAQDILREYELLYPETVRTEEVPLKRKNIIFSKIKGAERISNPENAEKFDNGKKKEKSKNRKPEKAAEKSSAPSAQSKEPEKALPPLTENEKAVYDAMPYGKGITSDEISRADIPIGAVLTALTTLEIKKLVTALPGGLYIKI